MKKWVVLFAIVVICICIGAYNMFSIVYERVGYSNEMTDALAHAASTNTLSVSYGENTKKLDPVYVDGLLTVLLRGKSELQKVAAAPTQYADKLILSLDEVTVNLYQEDVKLDVVFIEWLQGSVKKCFRLSGYGTFDWMLQATGFQRL